MKLAINSVLSVLVIAFMITFTSGCVEHRYVRQHHRHTPEYYHRHNMPEPRVDVNIHN